MGFLATNFNIGTMPVLICPADGNPQNLHIHNNSEHDVFLGGSNVGTGTGLIVKKQETEEFYIVPGDELYAISNGDNRDIRIIRWRR